MKIRRADWYPLTKKKFFPFFFSCLARKEREKKISSHNDQDHQEEISSGPQKSSFFIHRYHIIDSFFFSKRSTNQQTNKKLRNRWNVYNNNPPNKSLYWAQFFSIHRDVWQPWALFLRFFKVAQGSHVFSSKCCRSNSAQKRLQYSSNTFFDRHIRSNKRFFVILWGRR